MYTSCVCVVSFCLLFFSSSRDEQREQQQQSESVSFYARMCCVCVGVPLFFHNFTFKKKSGGQTQNCKNQLEKISESKKTKITTEMAPASDAGEIAKEEVDAVFAAALAAAPPLREVPPPPSFIRQTDETKEEEVKEEIGVNVVNVPPPPNATMGNNTIQREQHEQRAISTFIVKADDDEKIITQTEKEEEKLALTAREAFLATFANYDKKKTLGLRNGDEKEDEERGKMLPSSSEAIKLKNPPPNPIRLQSPYGLIDPLKCTATGTLVSGCKKSETAKVYVQMRDEMGNALTKPTKEEVEMMKKCGKMTVEGRVLLASTTKENALKEEFDTFELKVMDGKSLVYYGEYRPLREERTTYMWMWCSTSKEIRRITDGLRLKGRRFRSILKIREERIFITESVKMKGNAAT